MKKILIILGIVLLCVSVKSQQKDTIIALQINKEVIDLRTYATYSDSIYVIALRMEANFPFFGKIKTSSLVYHVYASYYAAYNGYEPIYSFSLLEYNVGYPENGVSAITILYQIRNDLKTKFATFDNSDVELDIR